ncbi:hypothetical protein [Maribacter sp. 2304DJ31-5]|uniref:hypothetical protein n=1 Tax=Maribacter sp. 2304DJ31-5 TaxID=3386273 RepID=UPI0039BD3EE7
MLSTIKAVKLNLIPPIVNQDVCLNSFGYIHLFNLKDRTINLEEVIARPYNLTGEIDFDIKKPGLKPGVTSSSLGLSNADVKIMGQSERLLLEADKRRFYHTRLSICF